MTFDLHIYLIFLFMHCTHCNELYCRLVQVRSFCSTMWTPSSSCTKSCTQEYTIALTIIKPRYRFTHKGWECKDDLKLPGWSILSWLLSVYGLSNDWEKKEKKLQLQGILNIRKQIELIPHSKAKQI